MIRRSDFAAASQGIALIAVLVALSILLALVTPFLLSMGHGDEAARAAIEEKRANWSAESVRDLLLHQAETSHFSSDGTPLVDGLDEYPDGIELPEAFDAFRERGRQLLGGQVWDLQRKINLNTASPLLLGNLTQLAARLSKEHLPDITELKVDDASGFPDSGLLVVDREVIHYESRTGNTFEGLSRGQLVEGGFRPFVDQTLLEGSLVIDYRIVASVLYPMSRNGDFGTREPYRSVRDLAQVQSAGVPAFGPDELDALEAHCTVGSVRENATTWGRGERVFAILSDVLGRPFRLRVRSAASMGGGTIVRIRSTDDRLVEYGLVWSTQTPRTQDPVNLPSNVWIDLLTPLTREFDPLNTVVEPLVPHPINVNTASREIIAATMGLLKRATRGRATGQNEQRTVRVFPYVQPRTADEYADQIVAMRTLADDFVDGLDDESQPRPFESWEDFEGRFFRPKFQAASNRDATQLLVLLYDNFQNGRPVGADMGTAPICFHSGPVVGYRAAAARTRVGGRETARNERRGTAIVAPSHDVIWGGASQAMIEEFLRLDRHFPFWTTYPINVGAVSPFDLGSDPAVRTFAHTLADAFPNAGFGNNRFPQQDGEDGGIRLATSIAPFNYENRGAHESNFFAQHPDGRNLGQEGAYKIRNSGPRANGNTSPGGDHTRISFPLTSTGGLTGRHAVSFWFKLDGVADQLCLYDLASPAEGDPERNRINLRIEGQSLVFEVIDEAGLDPEPARSGTSPERTAGRWEVPLADFDLQADRWYHVSLAAHGNGPSQMTLLVDNVPRGQPQMRTYLTREVPVFSRSQDKTFFLDETPRFLGIQVEDTEGFPPQGVLKIGHELFEYSSIRGNEFQCVWVNSTGGRLGRARVDEFDTPIPLGGELTQAERDRILVDERSTILGAHPEGSAVELYGYSIPVYSVPGRFLQPGSMQLAEDIGAFAIGRMINNQSQGDPIVINAMGPQGPFIVRLGFGYADGQNTSSGGGITNEDIVLASPVSADVPQADIDPEILEAFPAGGGYCLLIQRRVSIGLANAGPNITFEPTEIGGYEVIRYDRRDNDTLRGIQRNVVASWTDIQTTNDDFFDRQPRNFVSDWTVRLVGQNPIPLDELPLWNVFVVPISIPVTGNLPPETGLDEWVQIFEGEGEASERLTEWVRYNKVRDGRHLVRAHQRAWDRVRIRLTGQRNGDGFDLDQGGNSNNVPTSDLEPWNAYIPAHDGPNGIGFIEPIEKRYPAIYVARDALGFRGDTFPETRAEDIFLPNGDGNPDYDTTNYTRSDLTTPHPHAGGTQVLPVHRFEFDWRSSSATAGRAGRNDRVALVSGNTREGGQPALVEWQTVNWAARYYSSANTQVPNNAGQQIVGAEEEVGPGSFQLVAFKAPLAQQMVSVHQAGTVNRTDARYVDRMIKFPSGELPAIDPDDGVVGGTDLGDLTQAAGIVDEISVVANAAYPRPLVTSVTATEANRMFVRPDVFLTGNGALVGFKPQQWADFGQNEAFPETGGLLWVDGEIIAFSNYDPSTGQIEIAADGRALLGSGADGSDTGRGHAEGTPVYFLEQVPAAILSGSISESSYEFPVDGLGGMPRFGGTVLVGRSELAHYTWSVANNALAMPRWFDPEDSGRAGTGLFRGRFGTNPISAPAGSALIWFPFRYWDRFRERAEDPAMAYAQFTLHQGPMWIEAFGWEEEQIDAQVDLKCYIRVDGRGSFADDPETTDGLWLLRDGKDGDGKIPRIGAQGSRLEARFVVEWSGGSFDSAQFRAHAWKHVPKLENFALTYEGETRIQFEEVTAR